MTRDELLKLYTEGKRDFSHADLRGADLSNLNLPSANLSYADLRGADLLCANLPYANLSYANLSGADLYNAGLSNAGLRGANLSFADLSDAKLLFANLSEADLRGADLSGANLRYTANLSNANLSGAKYEHIVIKHVRVFSSFYRYQVWAIIADDDSEWIRMGCFFRKREEWENDFWNNDREFKNDNSENSNMRLAAFNFACKWIDERKHTIEKTK